MESLPAGQSAVLPKTVIVVSELVAAQRACPDCVMLEGSPRFGVRPDDDGVWVTSAAGGRRILLPADFRRRAFESLHFFGASGRARDEEDGCQAVFVAWDGQGRDGLPRLSA